MSVVSSPDVRASDPSEFAITIGSYELLEGIGSDAVSEVWLARSLSQPDRVLRLVRLRRDAVGDTESREAFLGFMRKAAERRSPLLLRVLAVGAEGDGVYAVLEHVEGVDLGALLSMARDDGERLPPGMALRILFDVIAALDALGGPHGDLAPEAILLTAGGVTVLSPVSLAVAACRAPREGALRRLAYKAPEQLAEQKHASGSVRADVFALGAILFQALAGRPLVGGADGDDIAGAMASALPPDVHELPAELKKVVLKALARNAADRYAGPAELGQALEKAAPALVLDRHQIASTFWHLAGNDLAARRFELESLMQGATEVAAEEARRSSEFPPANAPSEEEEEQTEAADEAEAREDAGSGDAGQRAAAEEAERKDAAEAEEAEQEKAEPKVAPRRAGAGAKGSPAERDEPPMVHQRSIPPERTAQTRRVVTGVVIGAAALLLLGLIVRPGHRADAPSATPDTAATYATPPEKARNTEPAPAATETDRPAIEAPATASIAEPPPSEPQTAEPAPPPASADEAPAPVAHQKKKHKHHATVAAPVKTASSAPTTAPTASAAPPVKHVASFGALPAPAKPKPKSTSAVPVPTAPF